jgi:hypothetical protein
MSQFIRHLNQIKNKRTFEWLTPSQRAALSSIKNVLQVPSTVNLFGPAGTGKTFLGWTLANVLSFAYLTHPDKIIQFNKLDHEGVVVDNCNSERNAHRELLKMIRFQQINHAVFITRRMIKDYTHFVELYVTAHDIETVQQNLIHAKIPLIHRDNPPNLWCLVNSSL